MVERIEQGMPSGTIGLKASGKLTADDYRDVMEPALQEAIEGGEARVLCQGDAPVRLAGPRRDEDLRAGPARGGEELGRRLTRERPDQDSNLGPTP